MEAERRRDVDGDEDEVEKLELRKKLKERGFRVDGFQNTLDLFWTSVLFGSNGFLRKWMVT
jgi:hypothetical protein